MIMTTPDDNSLDDQIRKVAAFAVPGAVDRRLREQLAVFRTRLSHAEPDTLRDVLWKKPEWFWPGLASAAALVLAVLAAIMLPRQTTLAEVATAVLDQPWVHLHTKVQDHHEGDEWFSISRQVWASRHPGSIQYEDYRLQLYDWFKPDENVIYRGPVVWRSRAGDLESMTSALRLLVQQGRPPDKPLPALDILGPERDAMKVTDQRVDRVVEEGQAWLDYKLTVTEPKSDQPVRILFRIDTVSRLPRISRVEGVRDGKPMVVETRFDYPEKGPIDVYDLGAPRTAKMVDRVPTDDIKGILDTLRAGRERMDDYRAVFVKRLEGIDYMWWTEEPEIFYRKGDRFRRDFGWDRAGNRAAIKRPADAEDLGKWWMERSKAFQYFPVSVVRGSTTFTSMLKSVTDPDGSVHQHIESVSRSEYTNVPGEMYPPEWSMRPEFACRPPLGIGDPHQEPVIDLKPKEGPAGCILLTVRHTSTQGRVNERGIGLVDGSRYWMDPARDYIVMRWDWVMRDQGGKERVIESDTIEETARSPQGVWYATKFRRHFPTTDGKPGQSDQIYYIYLDFKAELPDSLFDPPRPGRIH
jgi:hypothetical protein